MKYCGQCGAQLKENAKYCSACGNPCSSSDTAKIKKCCKKCGELLEDYDMFCPECGEPCCTTKEWEEEHSNNKHEREKDGNYILITILSVVGLFAVLFLPIINCSSDWIDALSDGATTITFWDTMGKISKYGADVFDDLDFWIAMTGSFSCVVLLCGAANKSKGVCLGISALTALIMFAQCVMFDDEISELYFLSNYFSLWLGFWIPLGVHVISFFCALCVPKTKKLSEQQ